MLGDDRGFAVVIHRSVHKPRVHLNIALVRFLDEIGEWVEFILDQSAFLDKSAVKQRLPIGKHIGEKRVKIS